MSQPAEAAATQPLGAETLQERWRQLQRRLQAAFGRSRVSTEAMLLLIGLHEVGLLPDLLDKQQKQDLMHVGLCSVLVPAGYYRHTGTDADGWPQFELAVPLPNMDPFAQSAFLQEHLLHYFSQVYPDM